MKVQRRDVLQWAGVSLIGWGVGGWLWDLGATPAGADAATPPGRALLVGINHYGAAAGVEPLQGCLTDLALQRNFLIYRLGWDPGHIRVLQNQAATLAAIKTEIEQFLLPGLGTGDRVVLHFSGYGRQVAGLGPTLMPYDAQADGLQDLPLRFLSELRLPTGVKFYCCFDAGYQAITPPRPLLGHYRAQPALGTMTEPNLTPGPGMLWLSPTVSWEISTNTVTAGALTQTLTQSLWSYSNRAAQASYGAAQDLERQTGDRIHLRSQGDVGQRSFGMLVGNGMERVPLGAEAVVLAAASDHGGQLWLGGLGQQYLNQAGWQSYLQPLNPGANSSLNSSDPESAPEPALVLVQTATGRLAPLSTPLPPGTLLQERLRLLPRDLPLTIGLAADLDKVTRIDAVSALDGVAELVSVTSQAAADFILIAQNEAGQCRYGLAWPGGAVVPHTLGLAGEAIKAAVKRLGTMWPVLLSQKWLSLTLNSAVSRLGVTVAWEKLGPQPELLLRLHTERAMAGVATQAETAIGNFSPQAWERGIMFQVGDDFQYRLSHDNATAIYILWLAWDSAAGLLILPTQQDNPRAPWQLTLAPGLSATLPTRELRYASPCVNSYLLCSRQPFHQALTYLSELTMSGDPPLHIPHPKTLPLIQALLTDLDQARSVNQTTPPSTSHAYTLDVQAWASFCFTFRVV